MWRLDMGENIRAGAHYTQFICYDFNGDGQAEMAVKTAPGTKMTIFFEGKEKNNISQYQKKICVRESRMKIHMFVRPKIIMNIW